MKSPQKPNKDALGMLTRLLALAEKTGLYLDVTGLGCYDRPDVARWYNDLAIPWALTWPNAKPDFYSKEVSRNLDFVSLHFYPKTGEVEQALKALAVYDIGKPMVIEEMFPLSCGIEDLDRFIDRSKPLATGWLGFYWGKTIAEYRAAKRSIADALTLHWLEYFVQKTPDILAQGAQR